MLGFRLLAHLALLRVVWSAGPPAAYSRPLNQDCVSSASSSDGVDYFPSIFQVQGEELVADDKIEVAE